MKKNRILNRFLIFLLCAAMMTVYTPLSFYAFADDTSDEVVTEEKAQEKDGSDDTEAAAEAEDAAEVNDAEAADESEAVEDALAEEDAEEEAEDETEYPAVTLKGSAGGVDVVINAPEGALPEGVSVKVTEVSAASVEAAAEAVIGSEVAEIKAVDISFSDKDGNEIEPEKDVTVTMTASGLDASNGANVVHVADNGSAEVMASVSSNTATFSSDEFSVYFMATATNSQNVTVHITNVLNSTKHKESGHAVAYDAETTLVPNQGKLASGFFNVAGGSSSPQGGVGYTYTYLKVLTLATEDSGMAIWDTASEGKTIKKISNVNGAAVVELNDGTKITYDEGEDVYISPVYKAVADWYLNYYYIDNISNGSGSWSNKGAVKEYSHKFENPEDGMLTNKVEHYKFLYWEYGNSTLKLADGTEYDPASDYKKDDKVGEQWKAGDTFTYDGTYQNSDSKLKGSTMSAYVYAIWQPSVTVNYHVLGDTAESEESFDTENGITVNYEPSISDMSSGVTFEGWYEYNEDGELVKVEMGTQYLPPEATGIGTKADVTQPAVHDLYAKFTMTHTVEKVWDDENDKRGIRPSSIEVKLLADGEACKDAEGNDITAELNADNGWTYTFKDLPAYNSNNSRIKYTTVETTDFTNGSGAKDYDTEYAYYDISGAIVDTAAIVKTIVTNIVRPSITVTAASDSKVYDGTELTNSNASITAGILREGDELETVVEGRATDVADTAEGNNKIIEYHIYRTVDDKKTDVTDKYNVTVVPGTLEITPAAITITAEDKTKVYDNNESTDPELTETVEGVPEKGAAPVYSLSREEGQNVGDYTITVTANADDNPNYTVTVVPATFTITPAPLKVTTQSATKVYDGKALTKKAASITGLVNGETATAVGTGSQTKVGSSKNGYSVKWGTADPANYEITVENLGTLTVKAAPATTDDDDDDNGGGGGGTTVTTAAAAGTGTTITDDPTPRTDPPTTIIDDPTPKAENEGVWALINLIAAILTLLGGAVALFRRKEEEDEDEEEEQQYDAYQEEEEEDEEDNRGKKMLAAKIAGALAAIAAPIIFILTEDITLPMVLIDKWTLLMIIVLAVQIVAAVFNKKASKLDDEEEETEEAAY